MNTSKIIKGVVGGGRYTVTAPIIKEDYGLYLLIEGLELPSTYEVDFSNSEHNGTSVTMIGNSDGVLIPNQFISSGKDVFAFLYHVGADFGRTIYKFRIPNKLRPDRTNEQPTPAEQSTIDQLISALNSAVEQTGEDVESASQSAQSAESAKTAAESARDTAGEYANDAESSAASASTSASQASASATASANSASASAQIKADVEELVDDAQGYAESASQSATASANSATTAQGYAQSASSSAQSASDYASQAQTSANTASAKAQDASQSATTASQKATESAQSASQALGYKTDAESAKVASQTAQGLAESARDSAVQAKTDAESAKADAESARDEAQSAVASISGALAEKAPIITDTASGAIASFSDGADNLPLKSLIVDINPIQDLSNGDPSPENICPISGWTQVQTTRNGSNLWNPVPNGMAKWNPSIGEQIPALTTNFTTFENDVLAVNTNWAWNGNAFITNKLLTGRTYRVTGVVNSNSNRARIGVYTLDANRRVVRIVRYVTDNENMDVSVTMGASDVYICVSAANATDNEAVTITNPCISESGVYEPYQGRSITIDLGQTVYGGKLDVLTGELTIDMAMVDLGTLNWSYSGESLNHRFSATMPSDYLVPSSASDRANVVCSRYASNPSVVASTSALGISGYQGSTAILVRDLAYSDNNSFKSAVNGEQLVYRLATPIEIQLSANQINSLYGQNNLWADSGDTEVVYRADTKLFIERLTAPDSADMIADANITSGKYFMVGNSLYKATANIANGSAIVVGTNCIRKSLSEALNEINA